MSISPSVINVAERARSVDQRLQPLLTRCLELEAEANKLAADRKSMHNMTRGLFVEDLINDARGKLVECQMQASSLTNLGDAAEAHLAIIERWVKDAADLLNRAIRVLDYQEDVFGRKLPQGGLWDK